MTSTVAGEITRGTAPVRRWNRNGIGSLIRRSRVLACPPRRARRSSAAIQATITWAAADLDGLVRIVKRKLNKLRYRPHLIDGCLAGTGLRIEPW